MTDTREAPLPVGIIGTGFNAREHANMLSSVKRARLAYVCDKDLAKAEQFADDWGATAVATIDELLASCAAVWVCTWTAEHVPTVEKVVKAGKAVFCEKPLGRTLDEALELVRLVDRAGVVNQVGLVLRYSPAFFWLKRLVASPASGRVLSVVWRSDQALPAKNHYGSDWRTDRARAGGGALLEHGIHDVDILDQFVGPLLEISCTTRTVHGYPGIEDVAVLSFHADQDVSGTLTSIWHDIPERREERRVEVFCERLWCALDGNYHNGPVRWRRAGEDFESLEGEALRQTAMAEGLATDNEDEAFVDAVAEGRPAHPGVQEALRAHRLVEAAYRSAGEGGAWVGTSG